MRIERLGKVVIGAHPQAGDPLDVAALGRGDQDRRVAALADRREDRLAVEAREHQVEDDEVDRLGVEGRDRHAAVGHDADGVPVALEIEPEELAEAWFVLDDQDPGARDHGRILAGPDQGNVKAGAASTHVLDTAARMVATQWPFHPRGRTTMPSLRTAGLAGLLVAAALVGGTIIGSVAAATAPPASHALPAAAAAASAAPDRTAKVAEYCAAFRKAFAADLGVDKSALAPAAKKAAIATIDAAVAAGDMPQAAGDRLKARIEAADADGCPLLAGRVGRIAAAAGAASAGRAAKAALGVAKDGLTAAAKALGITPAELGSMLRNGQTLKDVAGTKNVPYESVTAAVLAAVKADLDAAVAAGTIKQARADRVLAELEANLADGRLRAAPPAAPRDRIRAPTVQRRLIRCGRSHSKTMTWRRPAPARSRSKASSMPSRPIRRSISRSTGSWPARCSAA